MKKGIAFYLNIVAAILGIAGGALIGYSNSLSTENALTNGGMIMSAAIVGAVLAALGAGAFGSKKNHTPATAVSVLAAIALYSYAYGQCILQRILLIAGLFSYNSGNTVGWSVFYATIAVVVCLILGCLLLIVGSFNQTVKEA